MSPIRHATIALTVATLCAGAWAQTDAEHTLHHPAGAASKPVKTAISGAKTPPAKSATADPMVAMGRTMQTMHEMHEKMVAAKTPEERKALMGDHMKAMQDGMDMMKKMDASDGMPGMGDMKGTGGMGANSKEKGAPMRMMDMHDMVQKRMEMMTSMMQMMMDRLPASPAP